MPDRDEDKTLEQSDFSKGQREIADRALESARNEGTGVIDRADEREKLQHSSQDERITRCLDDPNSRAAERLQGGDSWREALDKQSPDERRESREQLTAEVLSKEVFSKEGYERYSRDRTDGTRAEKWEQLHDSEKLAAFRDGEELTARIEDRDPCRVSVSDTDRCGGFDPHSKIIDLDHSKTMDHRVSEKQAMETFFHEQAHAKQLAAIEKPGAFPEIDASKREEMRENFKPENYKSGGDDRESHIEYRDQPIERNAREEATERMSRIDDERRRQA